MGEQGGLADLLAGDAAVEETIRESHIENLDVLTADLLDFPTDALTDEKMLAATAEDLDLIKDIIESAYDGGADMIVTPCPVCQMNVEVYQNHINQKYKTNFKMPVVYYSTLMSVAYGGSGKDAGLDGQIIKAKQLEEIASK